MKTILVVDDEPISLVNIEVILNRSGYRVITESDASSALALVRDGAPVDLVITDYCMPDMDGLEFIDSLRRIAPALPLIMITGCGDIETYLKAINLGVFEYLNKPVKAQELSQLVKCAFERSTGQ